MRDIAAISGTTIFFGNDQTRPSGIACSSAIPPMPSPMLLKKPRRLAILLLRQQGGEFFVAFLVTVGEDFGRAESIDRALGFRVAQPFFRQILERLLLRPSAQVLKASATGAASAFGSSTVSATCSVTPPDSVRCSPKSLWLRAWRLLSKWRTAHRPRSCRGEDVYPVLVNDLFSNVHLDSPDLLSDMRRRA
jgi:hypothetical protein